MDGMLLLPEEGLAEADTEPGLMRGVPKNASVGEAMVFGVVTSALAFLIGGALPSVAFWGWQAFVWGWSPGFWEVLWLFLWLVVALFMVTGIIPIWALFGHAVLRLTGGSRYSVDRTLQAMGYSAGANVLSVIPIAGPVLGWLWWSVSAVAMVTSGQKVGVGRAIVAVYALPFLIALLGAATAGIWAWWYTSTLTTGPAGPAWAAQRFEAQAVHSGVLANAFMRESIGPGHALDLVPGGNLPGWSADGPAARVFLHPASTTTLDDVPVGDGTLRTFSALSGDQKREVVDALIDEMPDSVIAHRVGGWGFTYHGATLRGRDGDLWVIVMLPDPDVNPAPQPEDLVLIGTDAYGDPVHEMEYADLADELEDQNDYRRTLGLPPLPDLLTVTHANPAVAP
jgi:hypothetical protein